jgi:hypothetical protein
MLGDSILGYNGLLKEVVSKVAYAPFSATITLFFSFSRKDCEAILPRKREKLIFWVLG